MDNYLYFSQGSQRSKQSLRHNDNNLGWNFGFVMVPKFHPEKVYEGGSYGTGQNSDSG